MAETPGALEGSQALFVRRWGEMGGYWGINRTMAEIHALMFVSTEPLCTDDVMAQLQISRGNASMNLRSLVDWGLIERVHIRGDRKEYFICHTNVWQMFETIIRQRRRREIEPIIETIERCSEMVKNGSSRNEDSEAVKTYQRRLQEMHEFLEAIGTMVDLMTRLGPKAIGDVSKLISQMAGFEDQNTGTAIST